MVGCSQAQEVFPQFDSSDHEHEDEEEYRHKRSHVSQISTSDYASLHAWTLDLNAKLSRPHSVIAESQASSSSHEGYASVYMASMPEELAY